MHEYRFELVDHNGLGFYDFIFIGLDCIAQWYIGLSRLKITSKQIIHYTIEILAIWTSPIHTID